MDKAEQLYSSFIVNCVFNAFSSYTAIMLNIVTIHAMRKTSSLPKPLKTLLLSLAVSDLGVGLLVQPLYIAWMVSPTFSTRTALNIIATVFVYASFLSVVAISVDRFLAIHLHLRYQELVTHKRVAAVVISIWMLSAFLSSIWLWIRVVDTVRLVDISIQVLCFICTTIVYCRIYFTVRRHTNQMRALQVQQVEQVEQLANAMRQRKSAVSTFYLYLVFLICYLPNYCILVASIFPAPKPALNEMSMWLYSMTLVLVNSSLNPVIYCWKMRHIRHALMDILGNMFPSQN
ncbi:adenosine receptor A3-like [Oculina patagonica]